MSPMQGERHPFLDDLTADAELVSSPLRGPVIGREKIRLAVRNFYASQTPTFQESVGSRLFLLISRTGRSSPQLWSSTTTQTDRRRVSACG